MEVLKLGGVPEHFNMPWQQLIQSKKLLKKGIDLQWEDFPGGTGAMIDALNNNQIDMAMLLTEGAIKGIDNGGKYKIISFYVDSPLIWAAHVPAHAPFQTMDDIKGKIYAISRYGSGSHLMSFVDAQKRGWPTDNLQFKLVSNLNGARAALKNREADIFYWEKFTTKKYVDSGEFRSIGECPTPYACFVVCATEQALKAKKKLVFKTLKSVFKACENLDMNPDRISIIANYYQLSETDVAAWIKDIKWVKKINLDKKPLKKAIRTLVGLNLINEQLKYKHLVYKKQAKLINGS